MRSLLAVALLLAASYGPASSQALLQDNNTFRVAYGMSYTLALCGDKDFGRIFRKAVLEKFAKCPFTEASRLDFAHWTSEVDQTFGPQLSAYFASHPVPQERDEDGRLCKDKLTSPDYVRDLSKLRKYERGELSVDEVIPGRCDTPAGFP